VTFVKKFVPDRTVQEITCKRQGRENSYRTGEAKDQITKTYRKKRDERGKNNAGMRNSRPVLASV